MICKGLPESTYLVLCGKMRSNWGPHITFTSQLHHSLFECFWESPGGTSALNPLITYSLGNELEFPMSTWSLSNLLAGLHLDIERRLATARQTFAHPGTKGDASEHVWIE